LSKERLSEIKEELVNLEKEHADQRVEKPITLTLTLI